MFKDQELKELRLELVRKEEEVEDQRRKLEKEKELRRKEKEEQGRWEEEEQGGWEEEEEDRWTRALLSPEVRVKAVPRILDLGTIHEASHGRALHT